MKIDSQRLENELEYARKNLDVIGLEIVNYGFLGGLLSKLEHSKDGKISVDEIVEAYKLSVGFAIARKNNQY